MSGLSPVLEIVGLRVRRGEGDDAFVLDVPSMCLMPGQLVALHGPSGAGKSTLLETLAFLAPMDGLEYLSLDLGDEQVVLNAPLSQRDLDAFAHLRAGPVGFVAQSGGLLPFLDARHFASASARISGEAVDEDRLEWIVSHLEIGAEMRKGRAALSGGQRKRVALLRGLATPRRLLLVDEPSSGLDDARADAVLGLLMEIARADGTAVLAAMHDTDRASAFGLETLHLRRSEGAIILASGAEGRAA